MSIIIGAALHGPAGADGSAPSEAASPTRPNCGDYSILSNPADRAVFEQHCGTTSETDHKALLAAISRIDPVAEASAAARRGDFRLTAYIAGGPPAPENYQRGRFWAVEGVACNSLQNSDVVIWLRMSDALLNATQGQLQSKMLAFSAAYNAALLSESGFPTNRGCKQSTGF